MKACSYCGHNSVDDTACCSSCGTKFEEPTKELPAGSFRRPPRPEAASIVLRTFPQETLAQRAVGILREANIEAFIASDDGGGLLPPLSGGSPFQLIVSEVHKEAAEQVLADMEQRAKQKLEHPATIGTTTTVETTEPGKPTSTVQTIVIFAFGMAAGALMFFGYQRTQHVFSGTVRQDFNQDGRTDGWDTYGKGKLSRTALDHNGDEQPDIWYYYEEDILTRWEEDVNFDGKIDLWGVYDNRGIAKQSIVDLDFDGKADVTYHFQFGHPKESHYQLPRSALVWKKDFFTNGILRVELIDRNHDGKFDEKLTYDIYGLEVTKEKLE